LKAAQGHRQGGISIQWLLKLGEKLMEQIYTVPRVEKQFPSGGAKARNFAGLKGSGSVGWFAGFVRYVESLRVDIALANT
jgi:hypothetical protein